MDKFKIEYSVKNIPLPETKAYLKQLIESVGKFVNNISWRAHFFLNPESQQSEMRTFGFKTERAAPQVLQLKPFTDDLYDVIRNIKFKGHNNMLQETMKADLEKMKDCSELIVQADKTRNHYKMTNEDYSKLVHEAVSKEYKRCDEGVVHKVNQDAYKIAEELQLESRMEEYKKADCYVTVKDHKEDFPARVKVS